MIKKIFKSLFVVILGIIGGMLWQLILLPYLAENPNFQSFKIVRDFKERKVVIYPKEEKIIEENESLIEVIEKAEKAVIGIRTKTSKRTTLQGSGLILTSDGLVVTLADLVPRGSIFSFWIDNKSVHFEILERDFKSNLALIRIDHKDLPNLGSVSLQDIKKGQRVFLVGSVFDKNKIEKTVNQGIIKSFNSDFVFTNILESSNLRGSVLFDSKANVIGINTIGLDNEVITIPYFKIHQLLDKSVLSRG